MSNATVIAERFPPVISDSSKIERLEKEISSLRELLNLPNQDCESTAEPWWMIIIPRQIMSHNADHHASCVVGPYFSRDAAQRHLDSRRYEYGSRAVVYCMSGHWSREYKDVVKAAHLAAKGK